MAIPLLMGPRAIAVIISPWKRYTGRRAETVFDQAARYNQDAEFSRLEIEVFHIEL